MSAGDRGPDVMRVRSYGISLLGRASGVALLPGFDVMNLEQKSIIGSGS